MNNRVTSFVYIRHMWYCPKCQESNESEGPKAKTECGFCGYEVKIVKEVVV